ncbi:MAG TPA: hypothetical protein VI389_11590 [Geobacteraceae bacterium]
MEMSRLKSGQRAPPSATQNFFAQFSLQAQTAQNWGEEVPDIVHLLVVKVVRCITGDCS